MVSQNYQSTDGGHIAELCAGLASSVLKDSRAHYNLVLTTGVLEYATRLTGSTHIGDIQCVSDIKAHEMCDTIIDNLTAPIMKTLLKGVVAYNAIPGGLYDSVSFTFDTGTITAHEYACLVHSVSRIAKKYKYGIWVRPSVDSAACVTKLVITVLNCRLCCFRDSFYRGDLDADKP